MKIYITAVDENYVRVLTDDPGIARQIDIQFSYKVPGHEFTSAYRNHRWDGRKHLYNARNGMFPFGLLPYLFKYADKEGIDIEIDEEVKGLRIDLSKELEEFCNNIQLYTKYSVDGQYEYQLNLVKDSIKYNKTLCLSPTGSGKSHIIYLLTRFYLNTFDDARILICVPSVSLTEQMQKDFDAYTADGIMFEEYGQKIRQGFTKEIYSPVTISTWQSIYKQPKEYFDQFNVFICDEVHKATAECLEGIIKKMGDCKFKHGFTGTLSGTKVHEMQLKGWFGPLCKYTDSKALMEDNTLAPLTIDAIELKYSEEFCIENAGKMWAYPLEIDLLVSNQQRNEFICKLAANTKGNVLVLFNFIERHGHILRDMCNHYGPLKGKEVYYVDGSTKAEERERIRDLAEKKDNLIILASYGVFSTGINIRNLPTAIFAHPIKSKIRTLQSIGRILRKCAGKKGAKLIDIGDNLCYTKRYKENYSLRHFNQRLEIYENERFDYKKFQIAMKDGLRRN